MSAPKATRREWIGLAVLFLPCLLYSMDLTVLHLAVPRITEDLKPSSAQLLWIIDIYGFLVAGSLLTKTVRVVEGPGVTHLRFRVPKQGS